MRRHGRFAWPLAVQGCLAQCLHWAASRGGYACWLAYHGLVHRWLHCGGLAPAGPASPATSAGQGTCTWWRPRVWRRAPPAVVGAASICGGDLRGCDRRQLVQLLPVGGGRACGARLKDQRPHLRHLCLGAWQLAAQLESRPRQAASLVVAGLAHSVTRQDMAAAACWLCAMLLRCVSLDATAALESTLRSSKVMRAHAAASHHHGRARLKPCTVRAHTTCRADQATRTRAGHAV
jgi:hypothetical protein